MRKRAIILVILLFAIARTGMAQKMTVKDSDAHVLMEVNDEGDIGSITLPSGDAPSTTTYKLYNMSGELYWNGSQVGLAGSAGGWTDGGANVYLTTSTDKVGIGDTSPTQTLDVSGTIGINDTQILLLPDQTDFTGTLYLGDGGGSLSHTPSTYEGLYNTAVGIGALYSNTTGYSNVGIGHEANYYNQAGIRNTIVGTSAGQGLANHDKSYNVFIGYGAGFFETGSNKLYIENSLSTIPLIGGDFSADELYFNGYVGIGTTGPQNTLDVEGGMVVGTDYSGTETAPSNGLLVQGNVGIGDTSPTHTLDVAGKIGVDDKQVLYLPEQFYFTGTLYLGNGGGSLSHTSGDDGRYNTAVGIDALNVNETGYSNTASGYKALYQNSTGYRNTAIGNEALKNNSTGYNNTAIGDFALGSNTTGYNNTAIGYNANVSSGNWSNATAIGYGASVTASNMVRIGNTSVSVIEGKVDFTFPSDSTKKENFLKVDGEHVLNEIRNFNLYSWNYKGDDPAKFRHYGPMGQEFFSAFGQDEMGTIGSDTTLCGSDVAGINMIAIQALEKRTRELQNRDPDFAEENEKLKTEIVQLKNLVYDLREDLQKLESRLASSERYGRTRDVAAER